jgi:hypothetical protein
MRVLENFLGRKNELEKLASFYSKNSLQTALVYGRRRIGKTELIKHSLSKTEIQSVYFESKETFEENNVASLSEIISDVLGFPPLAFKSIEEVLDFVFKQASQKELVLVIDEYPYLQKVVKGLDSVIQSLIDKYKNESKVKLILCGSYIDTMKNLLEKQNPLFGRFDLIIDLKAMDYADAALFYQDFSDEDKVRLYSVFGGVPYYTRLIDSEKSVRQNVIDLIASPGSRLETEVVMFLKSEIQKMGNAYEVFETLAKGKVKFSDILSESAVSSSPTLSDILEKLQRMELVRKYAPINDENNKKKCGYYICDNLSLFYFKYIYRNLSRLNVMNPDVFFDRFIQQDFEEQYVPKCFEEICRQYLVRKNKSCELENPFEKIGRYYYDDPANRRNGEFDIVTQNGKDFTFYEAKFRSTPLTKAMIDEEIRQVNAAGLTCRKYGFFSRSGFDGIENTDKNDLLLFELRDLYK